MLETLGVAVEDFFQDLGQAVEDITEQIHTEIASDLEIFFDSLLTSFADSFAGEEDEQGIPEDFTQTPEWFLNPKVDPTSEQHPACRGCCHYHGRVYGENLLICGMHPYGWEGANCPDWQATTSLDRGAVDC
jgi:hypothetical protein